MSNDEWQNDLWTAENAFQIAIERAILFLFFTERVPLSQQRELCSEFVF